MNATSRQAGSAFAPTRWTLVMRAAGKSSEAQGALGELCECYWMPVFRFVRSQHHNDDTARELTQEFFARLLKSGSLQGVQPERGRFRSYLLGAVKHFLADVRDYERREKRGGGVQPETIDSKEGSDTHLTLQVPDPKGFPPDSVFDRAWALAVMERGLTALQRELNDAGRGEHFEVLKPWLEGGRTEESQVNAAARLGMSEGAVKVAVHRLRKRFRELVRAELAQTVLTEVEVDEEIRYLLETLTQR